MKHRYAARNENKNATELQGCKLRVALQILSTVYCRADFYKKRNPQLWLCIRFFFCMCVTLWVGSFFFFFFIFYLIYKYLYIYNNIYIQYIVYYRYKAKNRYL